MVPAIHQILCNMNKDKSIYACYEEIKQREISELTEKVRIMKGQYIFPATEAPCVLCNFDEGPSDVRIGSVEIQNISDTEVLCIFDTFGDDIKLSDIAYGHIEFISDAIPVRTFSQESFSISRLSRADLEEKGFDTSDVDDKTMQRLAEKLGDDYCTQLFWESLEIIAEDMGIPRKEGWSDDDEDEDDDE